MSYIDINFALFCLGLSEPVGRNMMENILLELEFSKDKCSESGLKRLL